MAVPEEYERRLKDFQQANGVTTKGPLALVLQLTDRLMYFERETFGWRLA
jgi:hypothetical protein